MTSPVSLRSFNKQNPCPVCGGNSGCAPSKAIPNGVACLRPDQADPYLWHKVKELRDGMGALFQPQSDRERDRQTWTEELGAALAEIMGQPDAHWDSLEAIEGQLRRNGANHWLTVLIFDQFEEFFLACPQPKQRRQFYEFLERCLDAKTIPLVKIILSLRQDYLHELLEFERFTQVADIRGDLLNPKYRYYLGNFDADSARKVILELSQRAHLSLQPELIDAVVADLASEVDAVRPIELQIVGAQLQAENITDLDRYRHLGDEPKTTLVQRWLETAVADCGPPNIEAAWKVLAALTDDKGTRPSRTYADLQAALELDAATRPQAPHLQDAILTVLVGSGLVVHWTDAAADCYQLVHDYLVEPIRQRYHYDLERRLAEAEAGKQQAERARVKLLQRSLAGALTFIFALSAATATAIFLARDAKRREINAEILAMSLKSREFFNSNQKIEALVEALKTAQKLQDLEAQGHTVATQMHPIMALQQVVYDIEEFNRLEGHTHWVWATAFSPDGKIIASGSRDKTVKLWQTNGTLINTLEGHTDQVRAVAFSPNGEILASGSWDKKVKLWRPDGTLITTLEGHKDVVYAVAFSPDGAIIASGSSDKTVKLWRPDGTLITTLEGHKDVVYAVAFSPDGAIIASGSSDKTVKLWRPDGTLITTLKGHIDGVDSRIQPKWRIISIGKLGWHHKFVAARRHFNQHYQSSYIGD